MQVYREFAVKTVQDLIKEKHAETNQKELNNTKETLNQAIFYLQEALDHLRSLHPSEFLPDIIYFLLIYIYIYIYIYMHIYSLAPEI